MPVPGVALERLGFLTIGLFDRDDPGPGHESTLEVIELGEQLGFDSAWLRHRHLQYGISSPVGDHGRGVAADPPDRAGYRSDPARLGEPVAAGRRPGHRGHPVRWPDQPGRQRGAARNYEDIREALYPDTGELEDFSYRRVERLLRLVDGDRPPSSGAPRASRSSPTGCSRTHLGCVSGCGTAGPG